MVVVLFTFPLSMVLVELVPSLYTHSFLLVMLKYVVGTSHHLLVPLGILAVRTDLRYKETLLPEAMTHST